MKFIGLILLLVVMLNPFSKVFAQDDFSGCINPAVINFPNDFSDNNKVSDEIYYQSEDEYTYWYKIEINADCKLLFDFTPLNNDDMYDVLTYKYQGKNLCNDIIHQSIKPVLYKASGELNAKKGETFYFSILHLNGEGCGHFLSIKAQNKELNIKAIHHNCVEQMMETMVSKEAKIEIPELTVSKPILSHDSVYPAIERNEKQLSITGVVVNKNTQKQIEAELEVFDLITGSSFKIISGVDTGFFLMNSAQNKYVLSVNKFGYEPFKDTILGSSTAIKLELIPIKVGEKIIMHKIYFYPNTYALKEESTKELHKLNKFMLENNQYSFEIQGHTNGSKSVKKSNKNIHLGEEWNFSGSAKKLSKLRAEKIKDYLVINGVQNSQLQTIGYGGDRMIVEKPKNMKEAIKNIRVEIIVLNKDTGSTN